MKNQNKKTKLKPNRENPRFNWKNLTKETYKNMLKNNISDYVGKAAIGDIEAEFIYNEAEKYLDINLYYGTLKEKRTYAYSKEKDGLDYGFENATGFTRNQLPEKYKKFKKAAEKDILETIKETSLEEYAFCPTGFWEKKNRYNQSMSNAH